MTSKKKANPIQKVTPKYDIAEVPAFMQNEEILGTESLAQYIYVQLLKIVQKNSPDRILDEMSVGDVFASPSGVSIAAGNGDEPAMFYFTPLFFYSEFIKWNKRNEKPAILERSFNEASELAKACRSSELRKEEGGIQNSEHLNWIIVIHDNEMTQPVVVSFARGEFANGRKFASLIKMRKAGSPLYGMRFQATVGSHSNPDGETWKGFDITNPSDGNAWITDETAYNFYKTQFAELAEGFAQKKIRADFSGTEEDEAPTKNSEM